MIQRFLVISVFFCVQLNASVTVKIFTGSDIQCYEQLIVAQRQKEFSQFPYLMDQGSEFEKFYASCYTNAATGALAVAYQDDTIVGFLTGMALCEFDALWIPFECEQMSQKLERALDASNNYYLGDVIVLEKYRGQKIVDLLFNALEEYAYAQGFTSTSFITVIRAYNHPQKPARYKSPVNAWHRLGYKKSGCIVTYNWPTRQSGEPALFEPEDNACDIWVK